MKRVYQSRIERGSGDCVSACLASILELDLRDVPNFHLINPKEGFYANLAAFLYSRGLGFLDIDKRKFEDSGSSLEPLINSYVIYTVPSQFFEGRDHAIVGRITRKEKGTTVFEIVHDPNPGNKPYKYEDIQSIGFLTYIKPIIQPLQAEAIDTDLPPQPLHKTECREIANQIFQSLIDPSLRGSDVIDKESQKIIDAIEPHLQSLASKIQRETAEKIAAEFTDKTFTIEYHHVDGNHIAKHIRSLPQSNL